MQAGLGHSSLVDRLARMGPARPRRDFSREDFTFDNARDIYMCPAGAVLTPEHARPQDRSRRPE
jgi:hypothetical protein